MKSLKKTLAITFALLIAITVFNACTPKGTGCPNNFSISVTK